jgi:two-component system cell cycle response regulator DivK
MKTSANKASRKVLIIDDDTRNIFALKAVLKSRGIECLTATDAKEGIERLCAEREVAVVLLDMMMPDMDGYQVLQELKNGEHRDLPVIAVTAQAMAGDRQKCLEAGADGYIAKPIDVDVLMTLLSRYF